MSSLSLCYYLTPFLRKWNLLYRTKFFGTVFGDAEICAISAVAFDWLSAFQTANQKPRQQIYTSKYIMDLEIYRALDIGLPVHVSPFASSLRRWRRPMLKSFQRTCAGLQAKVLTGRRTRSDYCSWISWHLAASIDGTPRQTRGSHTHLVRHSFIQNYKRRVRSSHL